MGGIRGASCGEDIKENTDLDPDPGSTRTGYGLRCNKKKKIERGDNGDPRTKGSAIRGASCGEEIKEM